MKMYVFGAFLLAGCVETFHPAPAPHPPVDAGTEADCQAACAHLKQLGCDAGRDTPGGATCESVCVNIERSGYASENPRCLAGIKSCADEARCTE